MKLMQKLISLSLLFLIVSCSSQSLKEQAVELPEVLPTDVDVKVQWWQVLGDESKRTQFGQLAPTVFNGHVFVPLASGDIVELDSQGDELNRISIGESITAPLAMTDDFSIAIDAEGYVYAFNGRFDILWSTPVKAMATRAAVISDDRVFVQTIDGRLTALERLTGRLLWSYQDAEPSLTLTGTAQPALVQTPQGLLVVTGLANGKFIAVNALNGSLAWEHRIAKATGKTDVSRLVDVDSKATIVDGLLVTTSYQGGLVIINPQTGKVVASKPFSSYRAVAISGPLVFGVLDNSHIVALDTNTLSQIWLNEDFEYRQISDVVVLDQHIVAADIEGYLHVIDKETGKWVGSRHIDWQGTNSYPVPFESGVLLQGFSTRIKYLTVQ